MIQRNKIVRNYEGPETRIVDSQRINIRRSFLSECPFTHWSKGSFVFLSGEGQRVTKISQMQLHGVGSKVLYATAFVISQQDCRML